MPASSQQQFKMMQAICHGGMTPPGGLTQKSACEFVSGQTMKGLPKKLSDRHLKNKK
jgi:hypothetical protein